uniref:Acyl_transf_3 domain-containing protein n=1 Tax=Globodera pallida TaxID=36090 RepID=A0A183CCL3_GLOPA
MEGGVNGGNFEYSLPVSVLFAWAFFVLLVVLSPIRSTNVSLRIFNPRNALTALFRVRSPTEQRLAFLDLFRVWAICWVISNHLGSEGRLDTLLGLPHGSPSMPIPFLAPSLGTLLWV